MGIPTFDAEVRAISALGTQPLDTDGLSVEGLKAKFDEAAVAIKAYINGTLVPTVDALFEGAGFAAGGVYDAGRTYAGRTVVAYDGAAYVTLKTVTGVTPTDDGVNYILLVAPNAYTGGAVTSDVILTSPDKNHPLSLRMYDQSSPGGRARFGYANDRALMESYDTLYGLAFNRARLEVIRTVAVDETDQALILYTPDGNGSEFAFKVYHQGNKPTAADVGASGRNLLCNGDMQIWQRGESIVTTGPVWTADRWKVHYTGFTVTKQVDTDGQTYMRIVNTSGAASNLMLAQVLENYAAYAGLTLTASFKMRGYNGFSGAFFIGHGNYSSATNVNLTADWKTAAYTNVFNPQASPTYQQGVAAYSYSANKIPAGGGVEIKAAKLEHGGVSTLAYDTPADYGETLAKCQRYLLKTDPYMRLRTANVSSDYMDFTIPIPVSMRISPSIVAGDPFIKSTAWVAQTGFTFGMISSGNGAVQVRATKTAHGLTDGYMLANTIPLLFSAEL